MRDGRGHAGRGRGARTRAGGGGADGRARQVHRKARSAERSGRRAAGNEPVTVVLGIAALARRIRFLPANSCAQRSKPGLVTVFCASVTVLAYKKDGLHKVSVGMFVAPRPNPITPLQLWRAKT